MRVKSPHQRQHLTCKPLVLLHHLLRRDTRIHHKVRNPRVDVLLNSLGTVLRVTRDIRLPPHRRRMAPTPVRLRFQRFPCPLPVIVQAEPEHRPKLQRVRVSAKPFCVGAHLVTHCPVFGHGDQGRYEAVRKPSRPHERRFYKALFPQRPRPNRRVRTLHGFRPHHHPLHLMKLAPVGHTLLRKQPSQQSQLLVSHRSPLVNVQPHGVELFLTTPYPQSQYQPTLR